VDFSRLAIAALGAVSIGGIFYVIFYSYLAGDARAEQRIKALEEPSVKLNRATSTVNRRDQVAQTLKEIDRRDKSKNKLTLETLITQAGLEWTTKKFYSISVMVGFVVALIVFVLTGNMLACLAGLFTGMIGLPRWALSFWRKRRIKKFIDEFPNAIDVIVRGIRSGLPIGDCLRIIATEAAEPVRSEFRRVVEAQTLGMSAGEACKKLYERVPAAESNFFGIVIEIQQKAGGNLSEVLSNLSRVLRERKKMKGKIIAMSMEAKASAGIIGSLPIIIGFLLWLSSPSYIELLWTRDYGKVAMIIGGMMMLSGSFVMKKMVNFDF
jgi:tight adherence protein B